MSPANYASSWTRVEDLDSLNRRIHDDVPLELLADRAEGYCKTMFSQFYPNAAPTGRDRVMEFGSGVGWIMEAALKLYAPRQVVGLDISANMIRRARERFSNPRAQFVLYDGERFPFADSQFDVIYSVASIQHIEKHAAFLLLRELYRVLATGGRAALHFLSVHAMASSQVPYDVEALNHVRNVDTHWHHYYAFDELAVIFSELIGVSDLDIQYLDQSFWVYFSKGSGRKYARPEVQDLEYLRGPEAAPHRLDELRRAEAELNLIRQTAGWKLLQRLRTLLAGLFPPASRRAGWYARSRRALGNWLDKSRESTKPEAHR